MTPSPIGRGSLRSGTGRRHLNLPLSQAAMAGRSPPPASEAALGAVEDRGGLLRTSKDVARFCYTMGMIDSIPQRRCFYPTPAWLVLGLLVVEGLLWLSERFQWLPS